MANAELRQVMGAFGDGCLDCYGIDIRKHAEFYNPGVCNLCQSFIARHGFEDAMTIVRQFFAYPNLGQWRNKAFGTSIFSAKKDWLAQELLDQVNQAKANDLLDLIAEDICWETQVQADRLAA